MPKTEIPEFVAGTAPASYLSNTSGLAISATGGLIAAADGTPGTGRKYLTTPINPDQANFGYALFEYNGDASATHGTQVFYDCDNSSLTYASGRGIEILMRGDGNGNAFLTISGVNPGGTGMGYQSILVQTGRRYCAYWVTDGRGDITVGVYDVDNPGGLFEGMVNGNPNPALPRFRYGVDSRSTIVNQGQYGGLYEAPRWEGLNRILCINASATNKILGVYLSQGNLEGSSDVRCQSRAFYRTWLTLEDGTIDRTAWVYLPPAYHPGSLIIDAHAHESDERMLVLERDFSEGTAVELLTSRFVVCGMLATSDTNDQTRYLSGSGWGAPKWVRRYYNLRNQVFGDIPTLVKTHWIGASMGTVMGLRFNLMFPGILTSLVSICGVFSLTDAMIRGYMSFINARWETTDYVAQLAATTNPMVFAAASKLPILAFVGSVDTAIPPAQHALAFQAAGAANVTVRIVPGAGHISSRYVVPAAEIMAFFVANDTDGKYPTATEIAAQLQDMLVIPQAEIIRIPVALPLQVVNTDGTVIDGRIIIRQNDTAPSRQVRVTTAAGAPLDLTSVTSVEYHLDEAVSVGGKQVTGAATVVSAEAGFIRYDLQAEDTEDAGLFRESYTLIYASGDRVTVPGAGNILVEIRPA